MSAVYFARRASGEGPIKIGCSADIGTRMIALRAEIREGVTVLAVTPGCFRDERRLHRQFADARVEGEWFAPTKAVMAAVAYCSKTGKLPPTPADDREVVMARRYLGGETLEAIAQDFGLTRERVRQLLRRAGVPTLGHRKEHRRKGLPVTDREREIAALYAAGHTPPRAIYARYDITAPQLAQILRRTQTPTYPVGHWRRHPDADTRARRAVELYRQGVSVPKIAEIVGLPFSTAVYPYLRNAGVPTRSKSNKGILESAAKAVLADYRDGRTYAEIASKYGTSPHGVYAFLKRHKVALSADELAGRRAKAEAARVAAVKAANARRARATQRAAA